MKDCHNCQSYQHGSGSKDCLKCPKYKDIQKQSMGRDAIKYDHLPQAIIEQVADVKGLKGEDIITAIHKLPTDLAAVITLRYFAGMRVEEIAGLLRLSVRMTKYKQAAAIASLKINILPS